MFAQDAEYVFFAEQSVERDALEKQIDISMKKGKIQYDEDGNKMISDSNVFDIFKNIPMTPSYWRTFRNEIFARLEQQGPFHIFFTLSCGESRWPEVFIAILVQNYNYKVRYTQKIWDGTFETVEICEKKADEKKDSNWQTLADYKKNNIQNINKFLHKHFVLVSRIFDDRVKNFVNNILLNHGVAHYAYRVEFQLRGLPHIHGVLWLDDEETKNLLTDNKTFDLDKEKEFTAFANKWTTCELPEDEVLREKVKSVLFHTHKYCKKKTGHCRFGFPKLPSKRTLIARPNPENWDEETLKEKKAKAEEILSKVKQALIDLKYEEPDPSESLDDFILRVAGVDYDTYEECLRISERGKVIILKRSVAERNIGTYHPVFLSAWNANIDVQLVIDHYAVLTYITDYFSKGDVGFTAVLKKAIKESRGMRHFDRLNYIKQVYFTHRQVMKFDYLTRS